MATTQMQLSELVSHGSCGLLRKRRRKAAVPVIPGVESLRKIAFLDKVLESLGVL